MYESEIKALISYRNKCTRFRMQILDMTYYVKSDLLRDYLKKCGNLLGDQAADAIREIKMYRKLRKEEEEEEEERDRT